MHPHFDAMESLSPTAWRFRRALLPGEGFHLRWEKEAQTAIHPEAEEKVEIVS
jgi:hypothetical protein